MTKTNRRDKYNNAIREGALRDLEKRIRALDATVTVYRNTVPRDPLHLASIATTLQCLNEALRDATDGWVRNTGFSDEVLVHGIIAELQAEIESLKHEREVLLNELERNTLTKRQSG